MNLYLAGGGRGHAEEVAEFLFAHGARQIDFIAEDNNGCLGDLLVGE